MRPALVGIEDAASKLGALLRALLCASDQDSRNAQAVIETGGKMWGLMVVEGRASPPTCVVVPQAISMLDAISTAARAGLKLCEGRDGRPSGLGAAAVGMIHQTLAFGWHAEARRGNAPKKHWDVVLRPAVETCFDVVGAAASIEWSLKQYGKQRGAQALALENMFAQRATARGSHPDREET
ncbi:hypothetical protein LF41_1200 [Lysobacter dokdonensis DS-58]|uniref:Uncharacterized protein n=2 Tax=Noviluteimonas TaxID=3382693 RepID=A0A0A2WPL9_9GAMM|nr:hypothetical protein LF41_1200 [Lysobacter dokdonensis DS-58]